MICFKNLIFDTAPLPVLRKRAQERGRGRGGVGEPMNFKKSRRGRYMVRNDVVRLTGFKLTIPGV